MGWNGIREGNERTLRRVISLLLALAVLAERASLRSPAVRAAVLWLLRPGADIASAYLEEFTGRDAAPHAPPTHMALGDSAADAVRLAHCFRTLAAALAMLLDEPFASWQEEPTWTTCSLLWACVRLPVMAGVSQFPLTAVERRDSS